MRTNKQTSEDRATQSMDTVRLRFAIKCNDASIIFLITTH